MMNRRRALGTLLGLGLSGCAARIPPVVPSPAEEEPSGVFVTATAPYVPTRPEIMETMLTLAEIGPRDVVYDLGCGDGRLVIAACRRFGARGLGVDLDGDLIARAQAEAQWEGVADRAQFTAADLFGLDLRPATVVMLYLSVEINLRLRPTLLEQLAPGSRIVSNRFDMADIWRPDRTIRTGDTPVHLWRIPPRHG
jgi:SAM-dependent methyltransferase